MTCSGKWRRKMSNEKWLLRNRKVDLKAMSEKYKISQLLCKLMVNRDIIDENIINSYINPVYKYLHSPKTMKDVVIAVDIIKRKIQENKKIRKTQCFDTIDGPEKVWCKCRL